MRLKIKLYLILMSNLLFLQVILPFTTLLHLHDLTCVLLKQVRNNIEYVQSNIRGE